MRLFLKHNLSIEKIEAISESSIYDMQADKKKNLIELDKELFSKQIKIAGLYDPEDLWPQY